MLSVGISSHSTFRSHPPRKEAAQENTPVSQQQQKRSYPCVKEKKKSVLSFFWALQEVVGMTGFTRFQGQSAVRENLGTGA